MSIGLLRVLYQQKIIGTEQVDQYREALDKKQNILPLLFESNVIKADGLAQLLSQTFRFPLLDLSQYNSSLLVADVLSDTQIQAHRCIPIFQRGRRLFLAVSDPTQIQTYQQLAASLNLTVDLVVVRDDQLNNILEGIAQQSSTILDEISSEIGSGGGEGKTVTVGDDEAEDGPVARFIYKILTDALAAGASDIHFEFYEESARVRFRVDGQLREVVRPPLNIRSQLASRIKVMAKLDISEKRIPQDGRIQLVFQKGVKAIDFRVSTLPTLFGEKIVIRILDPSSAKLGIEALGYEPAEKERLLAAIGRPYGMVLVTGPTGSGKTVSLYTCLNILNQPGVNISTVEDPAEINLPGINQVNVNDRAGMNFSVALKAFLRQDPDIIMVGEIRDLDTADIAIKAAQTGHMVMSTLHTNDAPTTLTRMMNMGVAPFNIASSVILITAQRLARKLCENCKAPADYPRDALLRAGYKEADLDGSWKPYKAIGCSSCNNGYKGRVGIYQVMPISEEIQRIILSQGTAMDIAKQAKAEGVRDLRESGLVKVRAGVTSLEEVIAVTNE